MRIKPVLDRVVVKRDDGEQKTPGGLIVPDVAKERPVSGIVVAVGAGKRDPEGALIPVDVEVGQRVLFAKFSGTHVQIDGESYEIMGASDVLAVIEDGVIVDADDPLARIE